MLLSSEKNAARFEGPPPRSYLNMLYVVDVGALPHLWRNLLHPMELTFTTNNKCSLDDTGGGEATPAKTGGELSTILL